MGRKILPSCCKNPRDYRSSNARTRTKRSVLLPAGRSQKKVLLRRSKTNFRREKRPGIYLTRMQKGRHNKEKAREVSYRFRSQVKTDGRHSNRDAIGLTNIVSRSWMNKERIPSGKCKLKKNNDKLKSSHWIEKKMVHKNPLGEPLFVVLWARIVNQPAGESQCRSWSSSISFNFLSWNGVQPFISTLEHQKSWLQ